MRLRPEPIERAAEWAPYPTVLPILYRGWPLAVTEPDRVLLQPPLEALGVTSPIRSCASRARWRCVR
jgi:hypothetical protein